MSRSFLASLSRRSRRGGSFALAVALLLTLGFGLRTRLWAYLINPGRWPSNQDVVMHLQVGADKIALIDGSTSWDQSAEDALAIWNNYLGGGVYLVAVRESGVPVQQGDRVNSVFFADDVFGDPFGSDVLAITLRRYIQKNTTEADVVFNSGKSFNSYRGPLRRTSGGTSTLYDFHRVALHEFGHVLGLGHPDDDGQSVVAIMNSHTSDTDALQADDIAGMAAIYGAPPAASPTPAARSVVAVVGAPARNGFLVSRTGGTSTALSVVYHNGGSAIQGQDYVAFPGQLTLAAGQTEAVIPVQLLPAVNRNHKVKVFLDPGAYDIDKFQSKVFLSDLP